MAAGHVVLASLFLMSGWHWGCHLIGPSCLERQQRGPVTTIAGQVAAGQIVWHRVAYGTDGSQNDAEIDWSGRSGTTAPLVTVYATRADCVDFRVPAAGNTGPCAILGSAGSFNGGFVGTLTIANGRGNPEILGTPPEYKLWIVGDSRQGAAYTIVITWFFGPDC